MHLYVTAEIKHWRVNSVIYMHMITEIMVLQKLQGYRNYSITKITGFQMLRDSRNYRVKKVAR